MKLQRAVAGIAILCGALSTAHADTYTFTGDTTGAPVFNRPVTSTVLSSVGTAVSYDAFTFSVDASGAYSFLSASSAFDNFAVLYRDTFDPSTPLFDVVAINDDLGGAPPFHAGFLHYLEAGSNYVFVNTGFANEQAGAFTATISGGGRILPGAVTPPVPEPETWGMLAAGLGVLGWMRRRQRLGAFVR